MAVPSSGVMAGGVDSLNVAAASAVTFYVLRHRADGVPTGT